MINYTVGQQVYAVLTSQRHPMLLTVKSVGRKWVNLSCGYRVLKDSCLIEGNGHGYGSAGRVYVSEAEYQVEKANEKAWQLFQRRIHCIFNPPAGATLDNIQAALTLLGISNDE